MHALTPDLHNVIRDYVLYCETQDDVEGMEAALTKELEDEDDDDSEDIEVPKVLGDIYESVAGAIYLDSGMDLNTVWRVRFFITLSDVILTVFIGVPSNAETVY